jgi:hypothetical protein
MRRTTFAVTLAVLNDASEHIASAFAAALPGLRTIKGEPLVREADSRAMDVSPSVVQPTSSVAEVQCEA